ncbi:hypothetical protein M3M35_07155 [Fructilactobacillus myrtifloralis]|uniref:XRE family transcriptional regulator n=1 Tax=Fructilactobacillus myrtifloralis TaxID=2940301 RepID=A0ABY5BRR2_9LACO|nr:hypothetical protein [Fructilactobacillus myrtifloralis]USS85059.1 hypothetical protein M3M35_07155 [Fructilactobacillus myrtifloralis]
MTKKRISGAKIRSVRNRLGLTQLEFGKLIGDKFNRESTSSFIVSLWEEHDALPTTLELKAIADLGHKSMEWFFNDYSDEELSGNERMCRFCHSPFQPFSDLSNMNIVKETDIFGYSIYAFCEGSMICPDAARIYYCPICGRSLDDND